MESNWTDSNLGIQTQRDQDASSVIKIHLHKFVTKFSQEDVFKSLKIEFLHVNCQ